MWFLPVNTPFAVVRGATGRGGGVRRTAAYSTLDGEEFADLRSQIALLEESFKQPLTAAIKKQLNIIRRNGITSKNLVRMLSDLYHDHGMSEHDFQLRHRVERDSEDLPRIICSESFV